MHGFAQKPKPNQKPTPSKPTAGSGKLTVNKPGDVFEVEADQVADRVMRMAEPPVRRTSCPCGGGCSRCQADKLHNTPVEVQTKPIQATGSDLTEAPATVHDAVSTPGQALDSATREFMEPRFGSDLSHVRVHAGPSAAEAAESVRSTAFTVGNHIVFNEGKYRPHDGEGRRLIAHELTHVLQQGNGAARRIQRQSQEGAEPETEEPTEEQADQPATPPTYQHATENPALADSIYPAREEMLQRFVALYREVELRALPDDQRGAIIERVRTEMQSEIERLEEALPSATRRGRDRDRARIAELQGILRRGRANARRMWDDAVAWESRHHARSFQGEQLNEEVERRFETGHVPDWLQPLVRDYAGMRYRSAHGSYYSPVRLLYVIRDANGDYTNARAELAAQRGRRRRGGRLPQTEAEAQTLALSDSAALQRISEMHSQGEIPEWAWRQIVRFTELRVQHASTDWETTSQPPPGADATQTTRWQGILRRWRGGERIGETGAGSTGWRGEMYRRGALLTTRMVCNELAEAAARQRGVRLRGGIRGAADMYAERAAAAVRPNAPARIAGSYFRNARGAEDFIPGAGLFFINPVWQTTEPESHARVIAVEGLIYPNIMQADERERFQAYEQQRRQWRARPEATRGPAPVDPFAGRSQALPSNGPARDGWTYHVVAGDAIRRERDNERQWMTWLHEATVIRRIGDRVFTLETTDAGGGPQTEGGQTRGAAGFRTRRVGELQRPGVFVGYLPGTERETQSPATPESSTPPPADPSQPSPGEEAVRELERAPRPQ